MPKRHEGESPSPGAVADAEIIDGKGRESAGSGPVSALQLKQSGIVSYERESIMASLGLSGTQLAFLESMHERYPGFSGLLKSIHQSSSDKKTKFAYHHPSASGEHVIQLEGKGEVLGVMQDSETEPVLNQIRTNIMILFDNVPGAIIAYEKFKNLHAAHAAFLSASEVMQLDEDHPELFPSSGIRGHQTQIVDDIRSYPSFVYSSGLPGPTSLSCAVKHQFLEVVQQEGWYEALLHLQYSEEGRHLAQFDYEPEMGRYPRLLANARLLPINGDYNLFREEFFRGNSWEPSTNREDLKSELEEYLLRNQEYALDIDYERIPDGSGTPVTIENIEEGIIQAVGPENMTEIIRLCFDRQALAKDHSLFFETMVSFSEGQSKAGTPLSYAIIESPIYAKLRMIASRTGLNCMVPISHRKLGKRSNDSRKYKGTTYKVLLLNANIAKGGREVIRKFMS